MAPFYYHVDRHRALSAGDSIDLLQVPEDGHITLPGQHITVPSEWAQGLQRWFPNGVTRHGIQYGLQGSSTDRTAQTAEGLFEAIRRSDFPNRISRFQAIFAWPDLDAAHAFMNEQGRKDAPYQVAVIDAEPAHIADMAGVGAGFSLGMSIERAHCYWNGDPFRPGVPPKWEALLEPPVTVITIIPGRSPS